MSTDKRPCAGTITHGWHSYSCDRNGKLDHNGKSYCGLHHPPTVQAKRQARDAVWLNKFDAERKAREIAERDRLEKERHAALYPDLLAFIQEFAQAWDEGMAGDTALYRAAEKLIAKATGAAA